MTGAQVMDLLVVYIVIIGTFCAWLVIGTAWDEWQRRRRERRLVRAVNPCSCPMCRTGVEL